MSTPRNTSSSNQTTYIIDVVTTRYPVPAHSTSTNTGTSNRRAPSTVPHGSMSTTAASAAPASAPVPMLLGKTELPPGAKEIAPNVLIKAIGVHRSSRSFLLYGQQETREYIEIRNAQGEKIAAKAMNEIFIHEAWQMTPLPESTAKNVPDFIVFYKITSKTLYTSLSFFPECRLGATYQDTSWVPACLLDPTQYGRPSISTDRRHSDPYLLHIMDTANRSQCFAFSPDQTQFITGIGAEGYRHSVMRYSRANTASAFTHPHSLGLSNRNFTGAAWFADSKHCLIFLERSVRLVHIEYPQHAVEVVGMNLSAAAPLNDSGLVACGFNDGSVQICDFSMLMWQLQQWGTMYYPSASSAATAYSTNTVFQSAIRCNPELKFSAPTHVATLIPADTRNTSDVQCDLASVDQDTDRITLLHHRRYTHTSRFETLTFFTLRKTPDALTRELTRLLADSASSLPFPLAATVISYVHSCLIRATDPAPAATTSLGR